MRDTMTLRELHAALVVVPQHYTVRFDFQAAFTTLDSWRGDYSQLALGYAYEQKGPSVGYLLSITRAAMGATFIGYKGGEFVMGGSTPIRVANYGEVGSTRLVGVVVHDDDEEVTLVTEEDK